MAFSAQGGDSISHQQLRTESVAIAAHPLLAGWQHVFHGRVVPDGEEPFKLAGNGPGRRAPRWTPSPGPARSSTRWMRVSPAEPGSRLQAPQNMSPDVDSINDASTCAPGVRAGWRKHPERQRPRRGSSVSAGYTVRAAGKAPGRRWGWLFALLAALALHASPSRAAEDILIGGGSESGVYYQAALRICSILNASAPGGSNCRGRPTPGSVFNIDAVSRGLLTFGIAQSDRNWQATHGAKEWASRGPVKALRSVFSLHPETVLLVVRDDSGIDSVGALRGKRVNIGNLGSGQRGNAEDVLRIYGIDVKRDIRALELQQREASRALSDAKIDAFIYTVGNPSAAVEVPARSTPVRIIPLDSPGIRALVDEKPYYTMTVLRAGMYPGVGAAVQTFALKATVVTTADTPEPLVYRLTKSVFENLAELRTAHPSLGELRATDMLEGLSAPLHPGARRYFLEAGMAPP